MTSESPRIAIIKLSSLGDVVHALPVAHALRRALPSAHLTWVVEAREYAILRDHPDLDAVVPVDTRLWRRLIWRPAGARQVLGKVGRLRERIRRASFRRGHRPPGTAQERAPDGLHRGALSG